MEPIRAFFDASCPKCKAHIGWSGTLSMKPPCPRCGWRDDPEKLKEEEDELEEETAKLREAVRLKQKEEWAGRTPELEEAYRRGFEAAGAAKDPHDTLERLKARVGMQCS